MAASLTRRGPNGKEKEGLSHADGDSPVANHRCYGCTAIKAAEKKPSTARASSAAASFPASIDGGFLFQKPRRRQSPQTDGWSDAISRRSQQDVSAELS